MVATRGGPDVTPVVTTVGTQEVVRVDVYDASYFEHLESLYGPLTPTERMRLCDSLTPKQTLISENTICIGLAERLVEVMDPTDTVNDCIPDTLALGSGTTAPAYSNTSLNTKHDEATVTEYIQNGSELQTRTFVSEGTGNTADIAEVGLYADNDLLNHSLLASPVTKADNEVLTVTVTIGFQAA